ncbi:hypothetical protein [Acidiferrobacter sp.]
MASLKIARGVRSRAQRPLCRDIVVRHLGAGFMEPVTLRIGASSLLADLRAGPADV